MLTSRRALAALVVLALALVTPVGSALAHGASAPGHGVSASARANAEHLTVTLANLNAQYHRAAAAQRGALESQMLQLAITREQALIAMLEDDPAEFLRVALPSSIRASLPASVQKHIEEETDIEGTLEVLHEDAPTYSRFHYVLYTGLGKLTLKYADDAPEVLTGTRVRVRGMRLKQTLALGPSKTSTQTVSMAITPNTFGAQKTVVVLVNFTDNTTQPYTIDYAKNVVFTTTSNYYLEASYNQTWLTGDVVGWFTIALSSTVCDYSTLATQAQQAATSAGVNLSNYARRVYAFPKNSCGWWGLGTVGGTPSQAWVNGKLELAVVGHEMGHNFGLYHSHGYNCSGGVLAGCTVNEYGDAFDIMGNKSVDHFNSFQKERLGWLNYGGSPLITTVIADGTYTLDPYETAGGVKALKMVQATDPATGHETYYYLEYRQPIGFDASVSGYPSVLNGVVVHSASPSSANSSFLLDLTPPPFPATYDPGLALGQSYTDAAAGITITPVWANSTNLGVNVAFGSQQCVQTTPGISISPPQSQWVTAGTTVTYTITVTNYDSNACPTSSFSLQAAAPSGWSAGLATATISVAPGATASTTVSVTSPLTTVSGFYTITVSATDIGNAVGSVKTSATYVIGASLNVKVSTDRSSYRANQAATIATTVTANGIPVVGASVSVTVVRSDGTTTRLSATTDNAGGAVVKHRFKKQDPTGTYEAVSTAIQNGAASGTGATSFIVQ